MTIILSEREIAQAIIDTLTLEGKLLKDGGPYNVFLTANTTTREFSAIIEVKN